MTTGVVLFGGGGHARAVADVLRRLDRELRAVVDPAGAASLDGAAALRDDDGGIALARLRDLDAALGIGDNTRRLRLARTLLDAGLRLPAIVARTATVAADARLGAGTVVLEHAHVGPAVRVGTACIVNTGAIVEHDCRLGDGVHCAPGSVLCGAVRCGTGALVGAGAVALPGIGIGARARIGAGAAVVRPVEPDLTVLGVPARPVPQPRPASEVRV